MSEELTPFESIRRTNPAGNEFWSSRDFAKVLGYVNYRHFEAVIAKAKTACINSGQQVADHFVGSNQMIEIGSGAQRPLKTVMMSRSFQLKFRSGDGNGIGDQLVQAFAACFGLERRRLM